MDESKALLLNSEEVNKIPEQQPTSSMRASTLRSSSKSYHALEGSDHRLGSAHGGIATDSEANEEDAGRNPGDAEGQDSSGSILDFNDALDESYKGRGSLTRNQILAVFACGMSVVTDASELLSLSFIVPTLEYSDVIKGQLSACSFAGMLVGSLSIGVLSDVIGRRAAIRIALMIVVIANTLFSLVPILSPTASEYSWLPFLLPLRIIVGIGVGGSIPIAFPLAGELVPAETRGRVIAGGVASMWMMGSIYAAVSAWLFIRVLGIDWWWYNLFCTIPAAACWLLFASVPESPPFLLQRGRLAEANQSTQWLLRRSLATSTMADSEVESLELMPVQPSLAEIRSEWWDRVKAMLRFPMQASARLRRVTLLLGTQWFAISMGWYGLLLWVPTLMERRGVQSLDPYLSGLIVATANLPGNLATFVCVDRFGRKPLLLVSMFLSILCIAGWAFIAHSTTEATAFAALYNALSVIAWNVIDIQSAEMFPVDQRSAAMGLLAAFGRVGSLLSQEATGSLLSLGGGTLVIVVAGSMVVLGWICGFFVPETRNSKLN